MIYSKKISFLTLLMYISMPVAFSHGGGGENNEESSNTGEKEGQKKIE